MKDFVSRGLGLNLKVLKILRLFDSNLNRMLTYVLYFGVMLGVPVFGSLYFILQGGTDSTRIGDDAFVISGTIGYLFKLLPFITKNDRLTRCVYFLERVRLNLNDKQLEILNRSVKVCQKNSKIFLITMGIALTSWSIKPLLLYDGKLPIDVWMPIDFTRHPTAFVCLYLYVVLGVCYPSLASAAVDPLVAGLACLASAHLRVLKDNLQYLEEYIEADKTKYERRSQIIMYKKIQGCIDHHNDILDFIKEFQECFSQVVFSQFLTSVFVICFCCFQLNRLHVFTMEFFSVMNYLLILLVQIYFYCFYGTELYEESNGLPNAIYMGHWYRYDLKSRKALLMMMKRSTSAIVVTAGKTFDLSLETFSSILRRSYSLLAVLNNQK